MTNHKQDHKQDRKEVVSEEVVIIVPSSSFDQALKTEDIRRYLRFLKELRTK